MPFASPAFEEAQAELGRPLPVSGIMETEFRGFWRITAMLRLEMQMSKWLAYAIAPYLLLPARGFWYLVTRYIRWKDGRTVVELSRAAKPGHELVLRIALYILIQLGGPEIAFQDFWVWYYVLGDPIVFQQNYSEAWKQKFKHDPANEGNPECSLVFFNSNGDRSELPCSWNMGDGALIYHLRIFYYLHKAQRGIFESLGMKTLERIEVATLEGNTVVGRHNYTMELGRYKSDNRLIYYFRHPDELQGYEIVERLKRDGVLAPLGHQHTQALKLVEKWNAGQASIIVLMPIVASLIFSIIWSVVAVAKFHADVQTSVQTGFTVGSYIVTAGALLIALIAFLDTLYENSQGNR